VFQSRRSAPSLALLRGTATSWHSASERLPAVRYPSATKPGSRNPSITLTTRWMTPSHEQLCSLFFTGWTTLLVGAARRSQSQSRGFLFVALGPRPQRCLPRAHFSPPGSATNRPETGTAAAASTRLLKAMKRRCYGRCPAPGHSSLDAPAPKTLRSRCLMRTAESSWKRAARNLRASRTAAEREDEAATLRRRSAERSSGPHGSTRSRRREPLRRPSPQEVRTWVGWTASPPPGPFFPSLAHGAAAAGLPALATDLTNLAATGVRRRRCVFKKRGWSVADFARVAMAAGGFIERAGSCAGTGPHEGALKGGLEGRLQGSRTEDRTMWALL